MMGCVETYIHSKINIKQNDIALVEMSSNRATIFLWDRLNSRPSHSINFLSIDHPPIVSTFNLLTHLETTPKQFLGRI